ncbi:hypothetical protein Sjap_002427 [Stephania japonica]|uniref:Leucine-rich repeat-containing N-terminal plant-type domain-containing protein n=1 Tax=Stephania japonica TaxID=461633 RepID=A0AAP0KLU5_9MAGN
MASSSAVLLVLVSTLILFSPSLSQSSNSTTRCNPNDFKALMQIKQSLNNPYQLASWVPNTDCCKWYAIECDPDTNRVSALSIFSANISAEFPAAVGDLTFLRTILFRKLTNLTGSIPSSLTKLTDLRTLTISHTALSGAVPDFLSHLQNLQILDLSHNQLSGPIPPTLSALPKLQSIHLDSNHLTGPIPDSFGRPVGPAPDLYLSRNRLSGQIPSSLGSVSFDTIDLSRNMLVGDASMLFGEGKTSVRVDLSSNMLDFDLSNVRFSRKLVTLDLSHNRIFGSVPRQLSQVDTLMGLKLSYNRLCGEIPVGGKLQSFGSSAYVHNKCLCGPPLPVKCNKRI